MILLLSLQIFSTINKGVNNIDTAYPYHAGQSEPFLGQILTPNIRNKIKLATKLPPSSLHKKENMVKILDNQLLKLKTDHIDYYLLHGFDNNNWSKFITLDVFEFLDQQIKAALKLINDNGIYNAPMSNIAKLPNASTGSLYLYFENKQVLIDELYICIKPDINRKWVVFPLMRLLLIKCMRYY